MAQNSDQSVIRALTAVGCLALVSIPASGQVPDPLPPEGFAENEYVDGAGCAYVRFLLDGQVRWAPRLSENGAPICGLSAGDIAGVPADVSGTPRDPVFARPGFYVQVGAFGGQARAQTAMDQLAGLGLPALRLDMDWSQPITMIYAGPFAAEADAETARQSVQAAGYIDAFLRVQE